MASWWYIQSQSDDYSRLGYKVDREYWPGVCYDLSHSALAAKYFNFDVIEFTQQIKPFVEYLHIADASSLAEEGMQIMDGDLDLKGILTQFLDGQAYNFILKSGTPCSKRAWLSGCADTSQSALDTLMFFGVVGAGSAGSRHARNLLSLGHDVIICSEHSAFGNISLMILIMKGYEFPATS